MRTALAAVAASILVLASAASYAAAPGSRAGSGSGGAGSAQTGSPGGNPGRGFNTTETIDTQCANILAGGDNSNSAERRYCHQHGY